MKLAHCFPFERKVNRASISLSIISLSPIGLDKNIRAEGKMVLKGTGVFENPDKGSIRGFKLVLVILVLPHPLPA